MRMLGLMRLTIAVWSLLLSVSCTVGGADAPTAGGGIGGTGITSGEITDFGSIEVNETFYDIGGASITVDGQPANEAALELGMVVDVNFQLSGGRRVATSVVQDDVVEGEIDSIDDSQSPHLIIIDMLGQTVLVNETTNILDVNEDQIDVSMLKATDVIEVSGHVIDENGVIEATYVKVNTPPATTVLRGFVSAHTPADEKFQIGNLIIDYGRRPANISKMPDPAVVLWDGLFVQVLGDDIVAGELIAKKVEPKKVEPDDGDLVEIEGFVTEITQQDAQGNAVEFVIRDTTVMITGSTIIEGCDLEDIDVGAKLEVDGTFDNGTLVANLIKCKDNVKLESDIATIDLTENSFTLDGLPGVAVIVTGETRFQAAGPPPKPGSLGDFAVGEHVRVQGRETAAGDIVIARRVQRRTNPPGLAILQGPVDSAGDPDVTILTIMVDTTDPPPPKDPFDFRDVDDTPITRPVFFGSVSTGTVVKLKGTLSGGVVDWEEAQLEDD